MVNILLFVDWSRIQRYIPNLQATT